MLNRLSITISRFVPDNQAVIGHLAIGWGKQLNISNRSGNVASIDSRFTDIPRTSRVKAGKE